MIYIASDHIGTEYPLDHPRFCFHKWGGTYNAFTAAGADVDWLADGETWSQWKGGNATPAITITFSETRTIDYIGIAAHDLDLQNATLRVLIDPGTGFETVPGLENVEVEDDGAILFLVGPVDVDAVRVNIIAGDAAPVIGVLQAGLSMELPRRATYTALPISESEQTRYRTTQSVKGQVLGRAVEAAELAFSIDIANLSEDWRQATGIASWQAFTDHVRDTGPFFVASRPSRYPEDVAYGVADERPRFNRERPNRNISGSVSLNFLGYKRA